MKIKPMDRKSVWMLKFSARLACFGCLVSACLPGVGLAQFFPPRVPLHRLEYRDLGYQFFNQIPADGAYITSLTVGDGGRIYGATTGFQSYLFVYSPATNQVKPLGYLPGVEGVHHSLVYGGDGFIYLGGGKNEIKQYPINYNWGAGRYHVSSDLWLELEERYKGYRGGHLYRYDISNEPLVGRPDRPLKVKDLGVPVRGDGVYCLAVDRKRGALYGISYPHAHFFVYDLRPGRSRDKGVMFDQVLFGGPVNRTLRSLPRQLAIDGDGYVYASTDGGRIIRYDPGKGKLEKLEVAIPGEYMQVVDAWAVDGDVIYGGTSEGFLFRFFPRENRLDNLGKPAVYQRIRGLTVGHDGRVYGIVGTRDYQNMLFCYDPGKGRFKVLGGVEVDRSPYYSWRAHQFDAMVTGDDGTIYLGESDRRGHLFLYIP